MNAKPLIFVISFPNCSPKLILQFLGEWEDIDVHSEKSSLATVNLAFSIQPDVIILNALKMNSEVIETLRVLKKREEMEDIPVIVIFAQNDQKAKALALEEGSWDSISKPFDREEILSKVKNLLKIRTSIKELKSQLFKALAIEETKTLLSNMIVHDLRNPLTHLIGCLELVKLEVGSGEQKRKVFEPLEKVDQALSSALTIKRMIMNILNVAKAEYGKLKLNLQPLNIIELARKSTCYFETMAKNKGISISIYSKGDFFMINADTELIERVFENLLHNAIKNTNNCGMIAISLDSEKCKDFLLIEVRDTGKGIDKEYHEKIFEKFAAVEIRDSGGRGDIGLGLPFCKFAIEAHGGKIWVESDKGKGAKFVFLLPSNNHDFFNIQASQNLN